MQNPIFCIFFFLLLRLVGNEGQQWELIFIYLGILMLDGYSRFCYLGISVFII
jgi:hypothetical protein